LFPHWGWRITGRLLEITGDYWKITGGLLEITGDYATHSSCMLSSPRIGGNLDRPSMQEVATIQTHHHCSKTKL